jgi:hypothetical protein
VGEVWSERPAFERCSRATRHTWATLALRAGKSVRWVADVHGHADPSLTLRAYAHALREEEHDLSFLDFSAAKRQQTAPTESDSLDADTAGDEIPNDLAEVRMARREGLEPPTPRFEEEKVAQ